VTVRDFKDLLESQPFQPFRIVMSSGASYEVRHPEMAWLTRTNLYVGIDEDSEGIPGRAKMCSLLHITMVEPLARGRRRRKSA
jgi:hypothetical protein